MIFETGDLYHIYNQGNNRIPIFYSRENYLFFLNKINQHILPHADVIAWCLMPNHFHLMVYVHTLNVSIKGDAVVNPKNVTTGIYSQVISRILNKNIIQSPVKNIDFNKSLGVLLASYSRAINKHENRTGSLFRTHTHAECLTKIDGITPSFFNIPDGAIINRHFPEDEYPQVCFNYIHYNPVKARLVKKSEDWEFSSYPDYYGLRNGKLINKKRAEEFGLI